MTNDIKTLLLIPETPDNFDIKNIIVKFSKKRNNDCEIQPMYIRGILYPRKENI